ncbi:unnamed protein product [Anisakis simplex]|uniref:CARD domain-containing protein n=1 Tax=Anisakis simplex TaxID=6269 RepID=A0A0M3K7C4_ANISI|nr:unnamed protein product [Anisakis simplex]
MVTDYNVRWQLKMLDHDRNMPRNQIISKINEIVSKLPQNVQQVYKKLVDSEAAKKDAEYEVEMIVLQNRGAPQQILELVKQIHAIKMDMTLSRYQEDQKIRELKWQMSGYDGYYHGYRGGYHHQNLNNWHDSHDNSADVSIED